jgi:hypothetical protein
MLDLARNEGCWQPVVESLEHDILVLTLSPRLTSHAEADPPKCRRLLVVASRRDFTELFSSIQLESLHES